VLPGTTYFRIRISKSDTVLSCLYPCASKHSDATMTNQYPTVTPIAPKNGCAGFFLIR
jgi:hypothetical protein